MRKQNIGMCYLVMFLDEIKNWLADQSTKFCVNKYVNARSTSDLHGLKFRERMYSTQTQIR